MLKITIDFDDELFNIDSMIKCHDIKDVDINRSVYNFVFNIYSLFDFLYQLGFVSVDNYKRYSRLFKNRIKKLDDYYFIKGD